MRNALRALVAGSLFSIVSVGQSLAADVAMPAYKAPLAPIGTYNWTGFYAGVHAGYGWSDGDVTIGIVDPSGVTQGAAAAGVFPLSHSFDRDGYVIGGQIGYNYQVGRVLWGAEFDLSATGIDGSQTRDIQCPVCFAPNRTSVSQDMDWFGTLRARVGYTAGPWLLYGTGGLAFGHVKYSYLNTNAPFGGPLTISVSDSNTEVGWTVGAGFEYMLPGKWSAKVEYLYYDLGDHSFNAPNPLAPPALGVRLVPNFENTGSIVRAGLNYRFN